MLSTNCRLRLLRASDLSMILAWRNHPNVRCWMYTDHEITLNEHLLWYERTSKDHDRSLLIFECDQKALGFIGLHRITSWGLGKWGFYAAPDAERGAGRALGVAAVAYAFETMSLHKLCGEVIATNTRSLRLHEMLGFRREGILREQHFDGGNYRDVHCFGLLSHEWRLGKV